jgi:hypothetical protein
MSDKKSFFHDTSLANRLTCTSRRRELFRSAVALVVIVLAVSGGVAMVDVAGFSRTLHPTALAAVAH